MEVHKAVIMMDEITITYYDNGQIEYDTEEPTDEYDKIAAKMANIIREAIDAKNMRLFDKANIITKTVNAFERVLIQ